MSRSVQLQLQYRNSIITSTACYMSQQNQDDRVQLWPSVPCTIQKEMWRLKIHHRCIMMLRIEVLKTMAKVEISVDWLDDESYSVCILKFPYMWRNIISCSWSRRRSQEWYSLMEQFSTLSWFLELVRGQCLRNEKSSPSDLSRKEDVRAKISLSFHSDSPFDRFHFHRGLALSI